MADFIVWATFESIWANFAANPGVFGGPRDATISPTDDGNINVGQGDEFTYTGIPSGPGQFQGPLEMRSFTMNNGGTAVWMAGVGNSGGLLVPTNEIAFNTFSAGTAFTITSSSVISSLPYSSIFVPVVAGAADAMNDSYAVPEDASADLNVLDNDSGSSLFIVSVSQGANGGTVTINTPSIVENVTYDPNGQFDYLAVGETATDTFTYTISDGSVTDTATVTVTITGANDAPQIGAGTTISGTESANNNGRNIGGPAFVVTDIDVSDVVTGSVTNVVQSGDKAGVLSDTLLLSIAKYVSNDGGPLIDATETSSPAGVFRFNFGTDNDPTRFDFLQAGDVLTLTYTVTATDSQGASDSSIVTFNITGENDAPDAVADGGTGFGTDEDTSFTTANVLANDSDVDMGDMLSISAFDGTSANGALITSNGDGTFNYNPNGQFDSLAVGETATDTFTYTISDGNGGTDTATVTVDITGVNDAPVLTILTAYVPDEDFFNSPLNFVGAFSVTDADVSDVVTASVSAITQSGDKASVVSDADILSHFNVDGGATVINNGDTMSGPIGLTYFPNGDPLFQYLQQGDVLTINVFITVTDGNGGTDTASLGVIVGGINDAPVATDDSGMGFGTDEDTSFTTASVLANDSDVDIGDTFSVTAVGGTSANGALITDNGDGTFNYDPNGQFDYLAVGESTTDTFTYTITDENGATDTATVTITITGVNDAPELDSFVGGANVDESDVNAGFTFSGFFATDLDVSDIVTGSVTSVVQSGDGTGTLSDAALIAAASFVSNATGTTELIGNTETNNPDIVLQLNTGVMNDPSLFDFLSAGEVLTLRYTVAATDSRGASETFSYSINIRGENDDPVANDDSGTGFGTDEDTAFTTANVLTNDTDVDLGDVLTIGSFDGVSANGALITSNGDGTFNYDPNGQFDGLPAGANATDTFTYTVTDGNGGTDTATITIDITGLNDAPIAQDDNISTDEDTAVMGDVLADNGNGADSDPNGDPITVNAVNGDEANVGQQITLASGALLTLNSDGTFSYDPNGQFESLAVGESATDTFTYTITDGAFAQSPGEFEALILVSSLLPSNGGDGSLGFVINGVGERSESGSSVSAAGDFNGDGIDDLIIGAPNYSNDNNSPGSAFIVFGTDQGFDPSLELSNIDGTNGIELVGINVDDRTGFSVSNAGDVNGDGIDDIIVSAYLNDANANGSGKSYVVFGSAAPLNATLDLSSLDGSNGFALDGESQFDLSGVSVSGGGDINNDGFADLIVGANFADANGFNGNGKTYVVFGGNSFSASVQLSSLSGSDGFVINGGNNNYDLSGNAVSNAGDVNGDGFDDVVIAGITGKFYVVFGSGAPFSPSFEVTGLNGTNGFTFTGGTSFRNGVSASNAGDLNGDGVDDIVVGTGRVNGGAGEAYVIFGRTDGFSATIASSSLDGSNGFVIRGTGATQNIGESVSVAGDVNGDGIDDLLIGAPGSGPSFTDGETFVLFGTTDGFAASYTRADFNGTNGFIIQGGSGAGRIGEPVSAAGDVNGDGIDDLIVGSRSAGPNGVLSGQSYVLFGRANFEAVVDTATVTVTIDGVNDAPIAIDDSGVGYETDEDTGFTTANVLANDTDVDASDVLSVDDVDAVSANGALVTSNGDGTFNYDPNGQFEYLAIGESTTDTFTYTVTDGNGGFDTATVTIAINGENDAPEAEDDFYFNNEGETITGNVLDNDTDVDASDVLSAVLLGDVTNGTLTLNPDGSFSYVPDAGFIGVDQFTYEVSDGNGGFDVATVTLVTGTFNGGVFIGDDTSETFPGLGEDFYGSDRIDGRGGNDLIVGLTGDDNITGGKGADTIIGGKGDDTIKGEAQPDLIYGDTKAPDPFIGPDGDDSIAGGGGADTVFGQGGEDTINGGWGDDEVSGNDGDDSLLGGVGNDTISAGDGDDTAKGGRQHDEISGGAGDDLLIGNNGLDTLLGEAGNDELRGGFGNDTLSGGDGEDTLQGQDSNDLIFGGAGVDEITGGDGRDTLVAGSGADDVSGNAGNDLIFGEAGDDNLQGGNANDTLLGGTGDDDVDGGQGDDLLFGNTGNDDVDGGAGKDKLFGGTGDDSLNGNDGDDFMEGEDGQDDLRGGQGNDVLLGGDGNDVISGSDDFDVESGFFGDDGNDIIFGEAGDDVLEGVNGDDYIDGGAENDQISGGNGSDTLLGQAGMDAINGDDNDDIIDGGTDNDDLSGDAGNDTVLGGFGDDTINGNDGDDCLDGEAGDDLMLGQDGNDTMDGDTGNDVILGGDGDDVIQGGDGDDDISGGAGDDIIDAGNAATNYTFDIGADGLFGTEDDILFGGDTVLGGAGNDILLGTGSGDYTLDGEEDDDLLIGGDNTTGSFDLIFGGEQDDTLVGRQGENYLYGEEGADDFIIDIVVATSMDGDGNIVIDSIDALGSFQTFIMDFDGNQSDQICFNITYTDGSIALIGDITAQLFAALDANVSLFPFNIADFTPPELYEEGGLTFTDNDLVIQFDNGSFVYIRDTSPSTAFEIGDVETLDPNTGNPKSFQGFWQTDEELITFGTDKYNVPVVDGVDKEIVEIDRPVMDSGSFEAPVDDFAPTDISFMPPAYDAPAAMSSLKTDGNTNLQSSDLPLGSDDSLQEFAEAVFEASTLELVTEDAAGQAYGLAMPDNVAEELGLHDLEDTQAVILSVDDLAAH